MNNHHHRHHSTGGLILFAEKDEFTCAPATLCSSSSSSSCGRVWAAKNKKTASESETRRDETRRMMGRRREESKTGLRRVIHEEIHFSLVQRMPLLICEFVGIKGTNSREQKIHRNFVCLTHTPRQRRLLRIILSPPSLSLENAGSLKECHGQRRRSSRECQCTGLHEVSGSVDSKESECPMRSTPS